MSQDRRQKQTLRTILNLATQVVGLLLVLLVMFGAPSQMPTILGLATAGLTVVFQDFILAFFGWFVLMGQEWDPRGRLGGDQWGGRRGGGDRAVPDVRCWRRGTGRRRGIRRGGG